MVASSQFARLFPSERQFLDHGERGQITVAAVVVVVVRVRSLRTGPGIHWW